ncbi:hypothetical protein C4E44_13285 [Pseudomonas sp. MWU12-2312b]|uniref:CoA transferase n=1 Tax=Pseudomonas moorei TaxID=395599 RepID=UPI000D44B0BD|nr:CoA transferase [Pseudomonas moorei]PPA03619.1 hypothetical protein C4E44_13285 [Pseudomonas sp. MWU12-2312b]
MKPSLLSGIRIYQYMAQALPEKATEEWRALLAENNIPASRVNTLDDLFDDPQLKASGLFVKREHRTEGCYIEVAAPSTFFRRKSTAAASSANDRPAHRRVESGTLNFFQ